jgi:hypothetical protein
MMGGVNCHCINSSLRQISGMVLRNLATAYQHVLNDTHFFMRTSLGDMQKVPSDLLWLAYIIWKVFSDPHNSGESRESLYLSTCFGVDLRKNLHKKKLGDFSILKSARQIFVLGTDGLQYALKSSRGYDK